MNSNLDSMANLEGTFDSKFELYKDQNSNKMGIFLNICFSGEFTTPDLRSPKKVEVQHQHQSLPQLEERHNVGQIEVIQNEYEDENPFLIIENEEPEEMPFE